MKKIYKKGNYVIVDDGTNVLLFNIYRSYFQIYPNSFKLVNQTGLNYQILTSEIGTFYDEAGSIAYTEATLKQFLSQNTGKS
jgi:hypothetical protein